MEGLENIYYALGEMSYAVAKADGEVQPEEREKIHDIVIEETSHHNVSFDIAEIIFHILKKDETNKDVSYEWAMKQFRKNKHLLTKDMAIDFIAVVEKIALAFNSYSEEEKEIVSRFRKDIGELVEM